MSVWKACDLRGRYPGELAPELLFRVGAHAAATLRQPCRVLVAGDFRTSTPVLKTALAAGLMHAGAHVLDAGQIPTPVAYFAHRQLGTDAVFIVTASHNPPEYNGLKFMLGQLPPTPEEIEVLHAACAAQPPRRDGGTTGTAGVLPGYLEWIRRRWRRPDGAAPLKVVLDAGNGAWSAIAPGVFESLGFGVVPLYCEVDGRYPNRPPDSSNTANLQALRRTVRESGAALGIAWDGDGDRVAFTGESGRPLSADAAAMVLIRHLLPGHPAEKVTFDIKLSGAVRRTVAGLGGLPLIERSGHTFLKRRMIREDCLLGCEVSGHYFFRELHGGDDGLFTALLMAEIVAAHGSLDALVAALPPVFTTPDLRIPAGIATYGNTVACLRREFHPAGEITIDGLRLETADGSVLVRTSVTEPVITMRLEGVDGAALARLVERSLAALPEAAGYIRQRLREQEAEA